MFTNFSSFALSPVFNRFKCWLAFNCIICQHLPCFRCPTGRVGVGWAPGAEVRSRMHQYHREARESGDERYLSGLGQEGEYRQTQKEGTFAHCVKESTAKLKTNFSVICIYHFVDEWKEQQTFAQVQANPEGGCAHDHRRSETVLPRIGDRPDSVANLPQSSGQFGGGWKYTANTRPNAVLRGNYSGNAEIPPATPD